MWSCLMNVFIPSTIGKWEQMDSELIIKALLVTGKFLGFKVNSSYYVFRATSYL